MFLSFFLSVLYLSVSKLAVSAPSTMDLGDFIGGVALTDEISKILDAARLQIAQGQHRRLCEASRIQLLALPCSDEE